MVTFSVNKNDWGKYIQDWPGPGNPEKIEWRLFTLE
jgi:hypothetical protein